MHLQGIVRVSTRGDDATLRSPCRVWKVDAVNELLVLTIDVFDTHACAEVTLTDAGIVEQLPISRSNTPQAHTAVCSLDEVVSEALSLCTVAAARRVGILSPPEHMVITHPADWTSERTAAARASVDAAGFPPGRVVIRRRHAEPIG